MKSFVIPDQYRSPLVSAIKEKRKAADKLKKDFTPTILRIGSLQLILARHFGFCYGVENAIEIAFRAIREHPGKRIFLLSEMIHNPGVNADLMALGVRFLMDTRANFLPEWNELKPDDIVIIPAFGTTLELELQLRAKGINPETYETTCPFVEKVWNRAGKIGEDGYTVVIHGKPTHEETRATFSHTRSQGPAIIVRDMAQAALLARYLRRQLPADQFFTDFEGQYTTGFNPHQHLSRIGVVNQTTMLASETQAISDLLKAAILNYFQAPESNASPYFADTRDTLCYATNDNQSAVISMLAEDADCALVIGGYNSSNTSHLVELCAEKLPTYFIKDEHALISPTEIRCFDLHTHTEKTLTSYLPDNPEIKVMITSGASCPDALVERVMHRLATLTGNDAHWQAAQSQYAHDTDE